MRTGMGRTLVVVLAMLAAWHLVAPVQLGGRVSYVNVRGVSMEPTLYTGDLLVMRRQDAYQVGQVVAFVSDMNEAVIVHRIVDIDGDRHLLKGDNNGFLDRFTPTVDEIIGAEVLTIPGGERIATFAASTPTILLQGAMLLVTLWALRTARVQAARERRAARRRRAVLAHAGALSDRSTATPGALDGEATERATVVEFQP